MGSISLWRVARSTARFPERQIGGPGIYSDDERVIRAETIAALLLGACEPAAAEPGHPVAGRASYRAAGLDGRYGQLRAGL